MATKPRGGGGGKALVAGPLRKELFFRLPEVKELSIVYDVSSSPQPFRSRENVPTLPWNGIRLRCPNFGHPVQSSENSCQVKIIFLHAKNIFSNNLNGLLV